MGVGGWVGGGAGGGGAALCSWVSRRVAFRWAHCGRHGRPGPGAAGPVLGCTRALQHAPPRSYSGLCCTVVAPAALLRLPPGLRRGLLLRQPHAHSWESPPRGKATRQLRRWSHAGGWDRATHSRGCCLGADAVLRVQGTSVVPAQPPTTHLAPGVQAASGRELAVVGPGTLLCSIVVQGGVRGGQAARRAATSLLAGACMNDNVARSAGAAFMGSDRSSSSAGWGVGSVPSSGGAGFVAMATGSHCEATGRRFARRWRKAVLPAA